MVMGYVNDVATLLHSSTVFFYEGLVILQKAITQQVVGEI